MSDFNTYVRLGYEHITDPRAYDHMLFLVALCAVYQPKNWLRILILITVFTIGHSLTLSLMTLNLIEVDKNLIEFLIPLTIVFTALYNITKSGQNQLSKTKYYIAGIFGLIHGMGFSNYYKMLTMGEGGYWSALVPFNIGIELGQIVIVLVFIVALFILQTLFHAKMRDWNFFLSGGAFGISLIMALENYPF